MGTPTGVVASAIISQVSPLKFPLNTILFAFTPRDDESYDGIDGDVINSFFVFLSS